MRSNAVRDITRTVIILVYRKDERFFEMKFPWNKIPRTFREPVYSKVELSDEAKDVPQYNEYTLQDFGYNIAQFRLRARCYIDDACTAGATPEAKAAWEQRFAEQMSPLLFSYATRDRNHEYVEVDEI